MNQDLLKIKKYYGENMAHLCRTLFPSLLETEGLLYSLIDKNFVHNKFLYEDIIKYKVENLFKNYINSQIAKEKQEEVIISKTPEELLSDAGYILFECKKIEDVEQFKKYYVLREKLCTFSDIQDRLNYYHIFWAVKKNVGEIKRENFNSPKRQDEYGTSVISIQFTKGNYNTLSIKNRYNHTVLNPDSTFSNNLDNIIPGLTKSFEKNYNLNINDYGITNFEIPGYVRANDGRYYKFNFELNNIYYCPDNIIIEDFEVIKYYQEKERYILMDYFLLDMKNKEINILDRRIIDSFPDTLKNIEKIEIIKTGKNKHICIKIGDSTAIITIDNKNRIISYKNDFIKIIGDNFLKYNRTLKTIYLDSVQKIGDDFLRGNLDLQEIYAPLLLSIGNACLLSNTELREISLDFIKKIGNHFLPNNEKIKSIYLPNVQYIGENFLKINNCLTYIDLPNIIKIGDCFLEKNEIINSLYMQYIEEIGHSFLYLNNTITYLSLPNLKVFEYGFMRLNSKIETIELPKLEEFGKYSFEYARLVDTVIVPENIRNNFIYMHKAFYKNFRTKKR